MLFDPVVFSISIFLVIFVLVIALALRGRHVGRSRKETDCVNSESLGKYGKAAYSRRKKRIRSE